MFTNPLQVINDPFFEHIDMCIHQATIDIELFLVLEQMSLNVQCLLTIAGGKDERQSLGGRMDAYHVTFWLVLGFWTRHNHI